MRENFRGTWACEPSQKCVNKHRISSASAAVHRVGCNRACNLPAAGGPIHTTQETDETTNRAELENPHFKRVWRTPNFLQFVAVTLMRAEDPVQQSWDEVQQVVPLLAQHRALTGSAVRARGGSGARVGFWKGLGNQVYSDVQIRHFPRAWRLSHTVCPRGEERTPIPTHIQKRRIIETQEERQEREWWVTRHKKKSDIKRRRETRSQKFWCRKKSQFRKRRKSFRYSCRNFWEVQTNQIWYWCMSSVLFNTLKCLKVKGEIAVCVWLEFYDTKSLIQCVPKYYSNCN